MNVRALILVFLLFVATRVNADQTIDTQIAWVEGKPQLQVTVDWPAAEGVKELSGPVNLYDAANKRIWQSKITLAVAAERPWKASLPIEKIEDPKKQYRIELELRSAELELVHRSQLYFGPETAQVQTYGLVEEGVFPNHKAYLTLTLNAFAGKELKEIPVALVVRDAEDNVTLNRQTTVTPENKPQHHRLEITPDVASSVGPYNLEATLESDAQSVYFSTSLKFAAPGTLLPVSGMEHGDLNRWFASVGTLPPDGWQELWYSEYLRELVPHVSPKIVYDRETKHSGRQSLRVDYEQGKEAIVWGREDLPGKTTSLSVWVKGNESADQLVVHFHDRINLALVPWQRNSNFEQALVCPLNFAGWRRFSVPVLGRGLQASGIKGSTPEVDGPIRVMAFSIKPSPLPAGQTPGGTRTLWIDDLAVETQLPPNERLSIESELSQPDGLLTADGVLTVSVGNGHAADLKKGKLTLLARDAQNKPVLTQSFDLAVAAQQFANMDLPLKELAKHDPVGPIEIDLTYSDPSLAGARVTSKLTLKNAKQAGIYQDFEEPSSFSGYQPGKVTASHSAVVEGGADGSARALEIKTVPKQDDNSVLFHPALPGQVDRIELMVKGGAKPATLQPWFVDSGATGVMLRNYNVFWAKPIKVDWQDWRKVVIAAPPIPANYNEKNRHFLFEPAYPLNLALNIQGVEGDEPIAVRIDNVRVITHLPADQQLDAQTEYPDETRIHAPGSPLRIVLTNFAASEAKLAISYELRNYQGFVAEQGKLEAPVPAGAKQRLTVIKSLAPGIYDLTVQGLGGRTLKSPVIVLNAKDYFGDEPLGYLSDPLALRRSLNLMTERMYFDWDNTEPAPYLYHFNWFEQDLKKRREVPILPKQLEPLVARNTAATAAAAQAEQTFKAAEQAVIAARQAEIPLRMKLEASIKAVEAPRAAAAAALQALNQLKAKYDEAMKAAVAEKAKADEVAKPDPQSPAALAAAKQAADSAKAAETIKAELDKAQAAYDAAVKAQADAEKVIEVDRAAVAEKEKASADAQAKLAEPTNALAAAKAAAVEATKALDDARMPLALHVVPVMGFSADWAGPEAVDAINKASYLRWIPNMLQAPERVVDWSLFVRSVQQEYKGRFDSWIFWENPDLDQAPQSVPPERYRELLEPFHRWVKLYNPQAKLIAGGFNFDKALGYLQRVNEPEKLPFDEIAVQMNLGELSPEAADAEGFLDDLNELLKITETKRSVAITELDWGIGQYLTAAEQAAYHARAAMILNSRGASAHQFSLINTGFEYDGYGVLYRIAYGNTAELQTFKPYHVPKPSYFALIETYKFLKDWKFVAAVNLTGRSLSDNRAFIFQNAAGELTAAVWRAVDGTRTYRIPPHWSGVAARDVFGFPVDLSKGLNCTPLPSFLRMPAGYKLEQLQTDLRLLPAADDTYAVIADLHLAEPASAALSAYQAAGTTKQVPYSGVIPGGNKLREMFLEGLESESFSFTLPQPGNVLLRRRWNFDGKGQSVAIQLNDSAEEAWKLTEGQGNEPGVRESTFVLRSCQAGENKVKVRYEKPGNCSGYRLEPLTENFVPLDRWGVLNTRQTKGRILLHTSAVGTPLMIGKQTFANGVGAHAVSFIEYPLNAQFDKFEVTVGLDGSTEGRGSVICRVFVDGKERANSGLINGFSKPKTLTIDKLGGAQRMILSVVDAGDGNNQDLLNWVDGKLFLK